jgi:PAS domain S-box-containing protein
MAVALREKRPIRGMEAIAERPDGTRVPFIPYPTPLFDTEGVLIGAVNTLVDITERHQAEQLIRQSESVDRSIAAIVEFSDDAILSKNLDGIIMSWNRGAEQLFGYTAEETIGRSVTMLIPLDRQDEEPKILARLRRGERVDHFETIRQRKDGSLVDISLTISPVRDRDGKVIGASKIARDITGRRRAEEQARMLLREMDHRVKNLFALAGGVVTLSARSAGSVAELSSAVRDRLSALARAHTLTLPVMTNDGRRMEQSTTLHALIHTILAPYDGQAADGKARVAVTGADIPVGGASLTSLALLLNEFATNAAKYGALSAPTGHIDIECAEDGDRFILAWTERNGPPVDQQANGEGFGTKLVSSTVQAQLGGEISREWNPDGLRIRLSIVRDRVST